MPLEWKHVAPQVAIGIIIAIVIGISSSFLGAQRAIAITDIRLIAIEKKTEKMEVRVDAIDQRGTSTLATLNQIAENQRRILDKLDRMEERSRRGEAK